MVKKLERLKVKYIFEEEKDPEKEIERMYSLVSELLSELHNLDPEEIDDMVVDTIERELQDYGEPMALQKLMLHPDTINEFKRRIRKEYEEGV